jgi:nucleoside-diphosphate-sugar epimerase
MRLLVTGGTGFIGHHLLRRTRQNGWETASLSRDPPLPAREISNVNYLFADLCQIEEVHRVLDGKYFDFVVNLGGTPDHQLFFDGGRNQINQHFESTLNLVEVLDRRNLRRFIQVGSSDEYGNNPAPQNENCRERAISPYALAKLSATQFVQMLHRTENYPAVCIRLFLAYGPGQDRKRLIPQVIQGCLENRSFPVSEGKQLRDFCYVEDIVTAIETILKTDSAIGEVVNIASGIPRSVREVVNLICKLTEGGSPHFGGGTYRPNENMELFADITKAKTLLAWEPKTSIESGLFDTIEWIRENEF